jgi:hypothetical protein
MSIEARSPLFTVTARSQIAVIFPKGQDTLESYSIQTILWSSTTDIQVVRIEYTLDDGITWTLIVNNTTNTGSYNWTVPYIVPNLTPPQAKIRITDSALYGAGLAPGIASATSETFSILSDPLTIYVPKGGETWMANERKEIKWIPLTGSPGVYLKIEYSTDNGSSWVLINSSNIILNGVETPAKDVLASAGSYFWNIPSTIPSSSSTKVRISGIDTSKCILYKDTLHTEDQYIGEIILIARTSANDATILAGQIMDDLQAVVFTGTEADCKEKSRLFIQDGYTSTIFTYSSTSKSFTVINSTARLSNPVSSTYTDDFINNLYGSQKLSFQVSLEESLSKTTPFPPYSGKWDSIDFKVDPLGKYAGDLNKLTEKLKTFTDALILVGQLAKFFVTSKNLVYAIVLAILDIVQKQVKDLIKSWLASGGYFTFIPRHLDLKEMESSTVSDFKDVKYHAPTLEEVRAGKTLDGGFVGFLTRLEFMFNDTSDPSRPVYGPDTIVGGFVVVVDTGNISDLYTNLNILKEMFFLPSYQFTPPPPNNIKATWGNFPTGTGTETKFGVKIEWDPPQGLYTCFRINRCKVSGGYRKMITLTDGEGNVVKYADIDDTVKPPKFIMEYRDQEGVKPEEAFGGPKVVKMDDTGGGFYIDFQVLPNEPGKDPGNTYYYTVESGYGEFATVEKTPEKNFLVEIDPIVVNGWVITDKPIRMVPLWGIKSQEVKIVPINCIPKTSLSFIEHGDGQLEALTPGWGNQAGAGNWVFARIMDPNSVIMDRIMKQIDSAFQRLKNKFRTNKQAVPKWFQIMLNSIYQLVGIVRLVIAVIQILQALKLKPGVRSLFVPPATGGTNDLLNKLRGAQNPPTSGAAGYTAGMVFLFGGGSLPGKVEISSSELEQIKKMLNVVLPLFGQKTV